MAAKTKPPRRFLCVGGPHAGEFHTREELSDLWGLGLKRLPKRNRAGYFEFNNAGQLSPEKVVMVWIDHHLQEKT